MGESPVSRRAGMPGERKGAGGERNHAAHAGNGGDRVARRFNQHRIMAEVPDDQ